MKRDFKRDFIKFVINITTTIIIVFAIYLIYGVDKADAWINKPITEMNMGEVIMIIAFSLFAMRQKIF